MRILVLALIISVHSCASLNWKEFLIFDTSLIGSRLKALNSDILNNSANVFTSEFYLNILQYVCEADLSTKNISEGCLEQMEVVCEDGDLWDLMADAWSKYPYTGMLTASKIDWGAFDQCINIDQVSEKGPRILGKQCTYGLAIPTSLSSLEEIYLLSYCVPDSCSAEDVAKLITVDPLPLPLIRELVNEQVCQTRETNSTWDGSSIAVATLFCLFFAVIAISTIYEIYLYKMDIRNVTSLLTAFSLFTNIKKLAQTTHTNSGEQILVFHGLKVISMMWIVAGHAAGVFTALPVTDAEKVAQVQYRRYMQYLATAQLGVDTFFFISGFLLAYGYFKSLAQKPIIVQIKGIPHMIIHRYLRITPVVLMFFLYSVYLSQHIGSGPLFTRVYNYFNDPCKQHWWAVFLYIQNYYNPNDMCWLHLWYLSADWQLFLISPLILIPMAWQYKKQFKRVMIGLIILIVIFFFVPMAMKLIFSDFYEKDPGYDAYSRLSTYFLGVMFGFYSRCCKNEKYIFRKGRNLFMWCLTLVMMFGATTLYHEMDINDYSFAAKSIVQATVKPFWCLGLAFITYSCVNGYGGVVNWLLTAGWMQVISKLTFCLYIMHMPVILLWTATKRTRDHFSDFNLFFYWCGHFVISTIIAAIWSLCFESPLITIERILLRGGRRKNGDGHQASNKEEKYSNGISIVHKPSNESNDGV